MKKLLTNFPKCHAHILKSPRCFPNLAPPIPRRIIILRVYLSPKPNPLVHTSKMYMPPLAQELHKESLMIRAPTVRWYRTHHQRWLMVALLASTNL